MKDTSRIQWEYHFEPAFIRAGEAYTTKQRRDDEIELFNRLGADGWELLTINGSGYYFKRYVR